MPCVADAIEDNLETADDDWAKCYLQAHTVPNAEMWVAVDEAARDDDVEELRNHNAYFLSFLELSDTHLGLAKPMQLIDLQHHLRRQSQKKRENVVVIFVHGWRRSAAIGDLNVQNFRRLLAYSRSFLNTRCVVERRYCDAALTGIYIGWRGRSIREPAWTDKDHAGNSMMTALSGAYTGLVSPSFLSRKSRSDRLGQGENSPIEQALRGVEQAMFRETTNRSTRLNDKMLIVGHSLGGNILASFLGPLYAKQIREKCAELFVDENPRNCKNIKIDSEIGDLVVLINPATEAAKWTQIQQTERDVARVPENYLRQCSPKHVPEDDPCLDPDVQDGVKAWRNLYEGTQLPVFLSMTSTDGFINYDEQGNKNLFDRVTAIAFRVWGYLSNGPGLEHQIAIGHYQPEYSTGTSVVGPALGVSHEFVIRSGVCKNGEECRPGTEKGREGTRYVHAGVPALSWCAPANGELYRKRFQRNKRVFDINWEWNEQISLKRLDVLRDEISGDDYWNHAQVNIRYGLKKESHNGYENLRSVSPPTSPFWNMRSPSSAIEGHGGFYSYPLWCRLHQMFLDPITTPPEDLLNPSPLARRRSSFN
ncbi:MAG: hypothetical protein QNJ44_22900 [Rhodobacter sp.]|nr:hypothetical protein [Rhodobacter sp.]